MRNGMPAKDVRQLLPLRYDSLASLKSDTVYTISKGTIILIDTRVHKDFREKICMPHRFENAEVPCERGR